VYRENTEPLVEFYRKRNRLKIVDADGAVNDVYARLTDALA
jgi:adenylate kinase family enzyme